MEYQSFFQREYDRAAEEVFRLERLTRDVAWYAFEVKARNWTDPWWETTRSSILELHGARYTRGKRGREFSEYPVYYNGPVEDAPYLPPDVLLRECKVAREELARACEQINAAVDWAPGGKHYEALCETGEGAEAYRVLYSKQQTDDGQESSTGLEQASTESAQTSTSDVL